MAQSLLQLLTPAGAGSAVAWWSIRVGELTTALDVVFADGHLLWSPQSFVGLDRFARVHPLVADEFMIRIGAVVGFHGGVVGD